MKRVFIIFGVILVTAMSVSAETVAGGVSKVDAANSNKVVDYSTNAPVGNAKITLPKYNYSTYTDDKGNFELTKIDGTTIMSVEKEGYRPFSLTVNDTIAVRPMVLGIERTNISDIVIDSAMIHIGDDNYSEASAGAGQFKLNSSGPFYSKKFVIKMASLSRNNYLVLGSIIGVDTLMAKSMGQNKIISAYASSPQVYFNGAKIADIQLNGDSQKIKLPQNLIKPDQVNDITIKCGVNMMQRAYIDYDDIEIANLSIMSE